MSEELKDNLDLEAFSLQPVGLKSKLLTFAIEASWIVGGKIRSVLIYHGLNNNEARELGIVDECTYPQRRSSKWRNFVQRFHDLD